MSEFTDEQMAEASVGYRKRVDAVLLGNEVILGLEEGKSLRLVMERMREEADKAMTEFAYANLSDIKALQDLQARVYRFRVTFETLDAIVQRGGAAEQSLRDEEPRNEE